MKKLFVLASLIAAAALILSACGAKPAKADILLDAINACQTIATEKSAVLHVLTLPDNSQVCEIDRRQGAGDSEAAETDRRRHQASRGRVRRHATW